VVATITVGTNPYGVAVSPDGKHVYAGNGGSNNVSVIDTTTPPPSVVATITVGTFPVGVAVTPDGKHAYVANLNSNSVSVIDTTTTPLSVVATITVGTNPYGVAVSPDGKHVYVTNNGSNNISVIDTTTTPRPWWPRSRWGPGPFSWGSCRRRRCKFRLRPTSRLRASKGSSPRPRRSLIS
jgi:YVTN family beta-propeller protein